MLMYAAFCLTVTLALYSPFVIREERAARLKRRLAHITGAPDSAGAEAAPDGPEGSLRGRILVPLWKEIRRLFGRTLEKRKVDRLELMLLQAGQPFRMTPVDYRLLQLTLAVLLPFVCVLYARLLEAGMAGAVLLGLMGFALATWLPGFYLRLKSKARSKLALRELPDVLDLLTVSLEAGLGFDAALGKLVSRKEGVLPEEFRRCLEEIRLGRTRREALSGVRDRVVLDELKMLISSILQAEKLGIGMVQVLRVQSQEVREQRRQRAEEEAMKAPIKMLFPLVLFIFPSLFIVLLGPAIIQFVQTFTKL